MTRQWHWHHPSRPLFETVEDLQRAPSVMQQLFELPLYRAFLPPHLSTLTCRGDAGLLGQQQDSGFLSSNWNPQSPKALQQIAEQYGVNLQFFTDGGSVGRGGGAYKAILAQPGHSINGRIKITEQESFGLKYSLPELALYNLSPLPLFN